MMVPYMFKGHFAQYFTANYILWKIKLIINSVTVLVTSNNATVLATTNDVTVLVTTNNATVLVTNTIPRVGSVVRQGKIVGHTEGPQLVEEANKGRAAGASIEPQEEGISSGIALWFHKPVCIQNEQWIKIFGVSRIILVRTLSIYQLKNQNIGYIIGDKYIADKRWQLSRILKNLRSWIADMKN